MKKSDIIVGCSAFNNAYWHTIFYPEGLPRTKFFEHYCRYFDTYELNNTFYKFPTEKSLSIWYKDSPDGFIFSLKAPQLITHYKRFVDCERQIGQFYTACKNGLKEKLGCVLFQLPPTLQYDKDKLDLMISLLNREFNNVIEFRHESWWTQEVYDELETNNITFCSVSYPRLPETIIQNTTTGYVRLHGTPKLFYSSYSAAELDGIMKEMLAKNKWNKAYIYFNNTASTAGILNAMTFVDLLS